ncbi:MAG: hypothetical protein ACI9LH_001321, partial [Porticoccaceae bacterium]
MFYCTQNATQIFGRMLLTKKGALSMSSNPLQACVDILTSP